LVCYVVQCNLETSFGLWGSPLIREKTRIKHIIGTTPKFHKIEN